MMCLRIKRQFSTKFKHTQCWVFSDTTILGITYTNTAYSSQLSVCLSRQNVWDVFLILLKITGHFSSSHTTDVNRQWARFPQRKQCRTLLLDNLKNFTSQSTLRSEQWWTIMPRLCLVMSIWSAAVESAMINVKRTGDLQFLQKIKGWL